MQQSGAASDQQLHVCAWGRHVPARLPRLHIPLDSGRHYSMATACRSSGPDHDVSRSTDSGPAFSTLAIWSHVFQSCVFHPHIFHGPAVSIPSFSAHPSLRSSTVLDSCARCAGALSSCKSSQGTVRTNRPKTRCSGWCIRICSTFSAVYFCQELTKLDDT